MTKISKKQCWDILEERLQAISETRLGTHLGSAKLAVSVIISSGRDADIEFINSSLFSFYCKMACLYEVPTRQLLLRTIRYLTTNINASFDNIDVGV